MEAFYIILCLFTGIVPVFVFNFCVSLHVCQFALAFSLCLFINLFYDMYLLHVNALSCPTLRIFNVFVCLCIYLNSALHYHHRYLFSLYTLVVHSYSTFYNLSIIPLFLKLILFLSISLQQTFFTNFTLSPFLFDSLFGLTLSYISFNPTFIYLLIML